MYPLFKLNNFARTSQGWRRFAFVFTLLIGFVGLCHAQGVVDAVTLSPTEVVGGVSSTGTVQLTGPAGSGGLLVDLSSSNSNASVPSTVTVPSGATTATFTVSTKVVAAQTNSSIEAAAGGYHYSATLTMYAATLSSLSIKPSVVTGGTPSVGTVTLNTAAPVGGSVINLSSSNPAASVPATVTVPAGTSTANFTITTYPVATSVGLSITATQGHFTFVTGMSVMTGGTGATLNALSLSSSSVTGGTGTTGTVSLTAAAPTGGASVSLSSNSSSATLPASVFISAGATSASFTVSTTTVSSVTSATITASLGSVTKTAPLTINPVAVSLTGLALNPTTVTGGTISTGTVTLSGAAPSGGTTVTLTSSLSTATVPSSVTVAAGTTTATFTVTTSAVASQSSPKITATLSSASIGVTLTVNPPHLLSFSLNPSTLTGGSSSTGTVTLTGAAPTGGIAIFFGSNSSSATIPTSVTVAAGATTATITITTTSVATSTTATLLATDPYGTAINEQLVIQPASGSGPSPWSKYRGNLANTAVGLGSGATGDVNWSVGGLGSTTGFVAGSNGDLYCGTTNGLVCAFTPAGVPLWEVRTGGVITATPTLGLDGTIYVIDSVTSYLHAVTSAGALKWSYLTPVASAPAFATNGTVYVSTYGNLVALNPNGTQLWALASPVGTSGGGPASGSFSGAPVVGPDGTIYIGDTTISTSVSLSYPDDWNSTLMAVNSNGTIKWSAGVAGSQNGSSVSTPAVNASSNTIYVSTGAALSLSHVLAFNASGTELWSASTDPQYSGPPVIGLDGSIYVGYENLYSFTSGGTQKWKFTGTSAIAAPPVVGADGNIYWANASLYALTPSGTEKWAYAANLSAMPAPVITSNGTVYVACGQNVTQISPSGTKAWAFPTGAIVTSSPMVGSNGDIYEGGDSVYGITSGGAQVWKYFMGLFDPTSAAIGGDGTIYTASTNALYAFTSTGVIKWTAPLSNVGSAPALASNGTIYIGSADGNLYAFNSSGVKTWTFETNSQIATSPTIAPSGVIYFEAGTPPTATTVIYAVNPNGTQYASYSFGITVPPLSSLAIGSDGTVYFQFSGDLYAFTSTLTQKWEASIGGFSLGAAGSPAIGADGTIYVANAGELYAVTPTGTVKWEFAVHTAGEESPAIGSDGTIYIGSTDANLYAITSSGTEKWKFQALGPIYSSPSIASDGTIYIHSQDGDLYAVTSAGLEKWALQIGAYPFGSQASNYGYPVCSPAIGADGTIYMGTSLFYAIH